MANLRRLLSLVGWKAIDDGKGNAVAGQRHRDRIRQRRIVLEQLEQRTLLATLPAGFSEAAVATGISNGTAMEFAPNGDLWVLEQTGAVKRFRPGVTTADTVGNVSGLGLSAAGERGLLGIAFDPQYATNKHVFLYYTATTPTIHNRISRFTVNDANAADYFFTNSGGTPTQTIIFNLDDLSGATNHNGGAIHFGPDGKLYVAVGENATAENAQVLTNLHGKMLRINGDGSIPADNPFVNQTNGQEEAIWALGLRNPFTFAFQPGTGRMFINDVGAGSFEEINEGIGGSNYGWPRVEGTQGTPPTSPGVYRAPLYAYSHGNGPFQGRAITGGAFYNPTTQQFPASYAGDYFFADFVNSWINVRDNATGAVAQFATNAPGTVDLRVAADGSLYYLARGSSQVFRVTFTPQQQPPIITGQPSNQTVFAGETANFSVDTGGSPPQRFQWQKLNGATWTNLLDGGRISGANLRVLAISNTQTSDAGQYRVVVANDVGMVTSNSASLTVSDTALPVIIDNADPGFSTTGAWISYPGQGLGNTVHYTAAGDGSAIARWGASVAPGFYEIAITWSPQGNRATNAPYRVLDGSTSLGSFVINQESPPGEFVEQGVSWRTLGTFQITGSSLAVELSNNANEFVIADAVRLLRVASPPPPSAVQIINDGGAGFTTTGAWTSFAGQGHQNMVHYAAAGTGAAVARWAAANVTPGFYEVAITWSAEGNRATNAPYHVFGSGTSLGSFVINQELPPGDFVDQGVGWRRLGTFNVPANQLIVELTNNANEFVIADAVRFVRVDAPPPPPDLQIISDGSSGFSTSGTWIAFPGQGHQNLVHYAAAGSGESLARWAANVTPGQYQIAVTWSPQGNRATNAPYRVLSGSTVLGTSALNQELAPNDFLDQGVGWEILGVFTVTGNSLLVELSNNANEFVIADAVRILRVG